MTDTDERLAEIERRLQQLELMGQGATATPGLAAALMTDDYIVAIKRVREATGVGLAEAKQMVDAARPELAQKNKQRTATHLLFWLLITLLGVAIWYMADRMK